MTRDQTRELFKASGSFFPWRFDQAFCCIEINFVRILSGGDISTYISFKLIFWSHFVLERRRRSAFLFSKLNWVLHQLFFSDHSDQRELQHLLKVSIPSHHFFPLILIRSRNKRKTIHSLWLILLDLIKKHKKSSSEPLALSRSCCVSHCREDYARGVLKHCLYWHVWVPGSDLLQLLDIVSPSSA